MHPNRTGIISEQEARDAVQHFVNTHFNNPGQKSRASVPAHQDDDDVLLMDYITQRERFATDEIFAACRAQGERVAEMVLGNLSKLGPEKLSELILFMVHNDDSLKIKIETAITEERKRISDKLRHIAKQYGAGGHTHREQMLCAIAAEIQAGK